MKAYYFLIASFVFFSCGGKTDYPSLIESGKAESSILIENVDIFNGREDKILRGKDLLIENGLISSIQDHIEPSANQTIIDGTGKTLMPGLIDAHVHLSGSGAVPWENFKADAQYNLQAYLYAGITTVYDLGGLAGDLSKLAQKVESGEIPGPSIYNTHIPITVKNGHPIPLTKLMLPPPLKGMVNMISPTIDDVSEAPKLMKKYTANDIDYVKIICDQIPPGSPEMSPEQLKALVEEAHSAGFKVFVHIGSPENAVDAVNAGADVLAHGVWRGKLTEEQAKLIAASNVPIIYTLSGFKNVAHIHHGEFAPTDIHKKLVPDDILAPVTQENGKDVHQQKVMNAFFEDVANQSENWQQNFQLLYKNGAKILVGTDSNLPGTYAGATYFQELDELQAFGMSNFEILSGATFYNAQLFLPSPDFGLVEPNRKADLLLLNDNPLENLQAVKNPAMIIKAGRMMERLR